MPILEYPEGRREEIVAPYFTRAQPDRMVAIIKSREPANILVSIGGRDSQGCHLDRKLRWVVQYNFYLNDRELGPLFIRPAALDPLRAFCMHATCRRHVNYRVGLFVRVPERFRYPPR